MENLRIKNNQPVQTDFMGNGAVYHGYAGMPDDCGRVYPESLCELEADRAADMKLKIARTFYIWWAWDEKKQVWNWDNEIMQVFYAWLQRMKDRGITVALNTGWCSPGDLNGRGWTNTPPYSKCPFIVPGDWEATVQNYANWVSETVHQLIEVRGFTNIKILVMFTEPQSGGKKSAQKPYECWRDATVAAHHALVRDGRRSLVKLMGPNEASIPGESSIGVAGEMLQWVVENTPEGVIDIYSCHVYPFAEPLKRKYVKTGKAAIGMSLAGGRFSRVISLKPHTTYTLSADLLFEAKGTEPEDAAVHFGVFEYQGNNDIHAHGRSGVALPLVTGSSRAVRQSELSDTYQRYEVTFTTDEVTDCVIGVFNDMRLYGLIAVEQMALTEAATGASALVNGDFSQGMEGWHLRYATGTVDLYDDWYAWCKQGMKHIPSGAPFVYDEYQVAYDRDFRRDSHASGIVTAAVAFMNAGAAFSLMWTLFDQQWPSNHASNADCFVDGDHRYGVMPVLTRTQTPHKAYYAFSLISRYVPAGGTVVYEGLGRDCLHTTMAVSKTGETTIIVVNNKEDAADFTLQLDQPIKACLRRYTFDPATCQPDADAKRLKADGTVELTDTLCGRIAPYSVIVYTDMEH